MYIVIVRSPEILPTTLRIKLCICVCIPQTTKIYYLLGCNGPWQATYNNNYCSFRPANRPWLNTFVCFPHISFIFSSFYSLYISVCMCVCVHVSPRRRIRSNDVVCTHFRQSRATFCGRLIDHKFPTKPHGY